MARSRHPKDTLLVTVLQGPLLLLLRLRKGELIAHTSCLRGMGWNAIGTHFVALVPTNGLILARLPGDEDGGDDRDL